MTVETTLCAGLALFAYVMWRIEVQDHAHEVRVLKGKLERLRAETRDRNEDRNRVAAYFRSDN